VKGNPDGQTEPGSGVFLHDGEFFTDDLVEDGKGGWEAKVDDVAHPR